MSFKVLGRQGTFNSKSKEVNSLTHLRFQTSQAKLNTVSPEANDSPRMKMVLKHSLILIAADDKQNQIVEKKLSPVSPPNR